jgi:hypothetical protein
MMELPSTERRQYTAQDIFLQPPLRQTVLKRKSDDNVGGDLRNEEKKAARKHEMIETHDFRVCQERASSCPCLLF